MQFAADTPFEIWLLRHTKLRHCLTSMPPPTRESRFSPEQCICPPLLQGVWVQALSRVSGRFGVRPKILCRKFQPQGTGTIQIYNTKSFDLLLAISVNILHCLQNNLKLSTKILWWRVMAFWQPSPSWWCHALIVIGPVTFYPLMSFLWGCHNSEGVNK